MVGGVGGRGGEGKGEYIVEVNLLTTNRVIREELATASACWPLKTQGKFS